MSNDMRINSIYQVSVSVDDLDGAIDFYRDKLGVKFIAKFPPGLAIFRLRWSPSHAVGRSGRIFNRQ